MMMMMMMMKRDCVIFLFCCFSCLLVPEVRSQGSASDELHSMLNQFVQNTGADVQSLTYCRISTRDLISTAQSTASRVLQGICNPRKYCKNDYYLQ
ncbi:hypothetical protein SK128_006270 [Halocaridina rubra]|uniref:Uncharacterized protein n=1 Tax=Halocaridina rubra TaxID=373956 RepID=A0AAN8XH80_HALRR